MGSFDETRAVALLNDLPRLLAVATPTERKAVVGAVFEKIWAGLANTLYG